MSSNTYVASNNANSTLAGSLTASSTSFSVYTGQGSRFPAINDGGADNKEYTKITLHKTDGTKEIVCVVRHDAASDTFTIGVPGTVTGSASGRGQEGTTATTWAIGDIVACRPTADLMEEAVNLGAKIAACDAKTALHDSDTFGISDSEASARTKKTTWSNIKEKIKAFLLAATGMIWTEAHIFRKANAIRSEVADTQDAVVIAGRAGGTSSYAFTLTPTTLTGNRTGALPNQNGTVALLENIQAQTGKAYTTGGTSTAFTLTPDPAITGLAENQEFDVEFHTAAGATPTLAISGLTAKSLKYRDSTGTLQAVTSTQVPSGWRSKVTYDGTDYIVREVPPPTISTLPTPYDSGDQTISLGGGLQLEHGLGGMPLLYQCMLHCTTADSGYSVGDYVVLSETGMNSSGSLGVSVVPDATYLNVRFGSGISSASFYIVRKDNGTLSAINNSNWAFVVRAWR